MTRDDAVKELLTLVKEINFKYVPISDYHCKYTEYALHINYLERILFPHEE